MPRAQTGSQATPEPPGSAPGGRAPGSAIEIRGLARNYGAQVALAPLDLDVHSGAVTGLLGPNGSGKTTLLRMLAGIVRPSAGRARVAGAELAGDGLAVRERAAYLAGEVAVYPELRGRTHLAWFLRGRPSAALERALELARELGLPLDKRVHSYSHGMKRQLAFAAALAPEVPVRLLDEASEGLDPAKRSQVLELLAADAARGTAILLSSHHLGEVERACARLVFLANGRLLAAEDAALVGERAARRVALEWPEGTDLARLAALLAELPGVEAVEPRARGLAIRLRSSDPRAFLAALASAGGPAPRAIDYGRLSLRELYQELYGVEGT